MTIRNFSLPDKWKKVESLVLSAAIWPVTDKTRDRIAQICLYRERKDNLT